MLSLHARRVASCACRVFLAGVLSASAPDALPQQLVPGQSAPPKASQTQPGKPDSGLELPVQTVPQDDRSAATTPNLQSNPQAPPMIFESHGLEYEAVTKNGITVMFAQLPSRLKDFSIVQLTVTNGSLVSWTVRPSDFVFVRQDGAVLNSASADYVVAELLQRANRDDVIKLKLLYENSIYGLADFRSTNGYEKRREAAMAQFVNKGFTAAAQASAIAFVPTKLKPGDSTDGAIFFENRTKDKTLGAGRLIAHTCGETFGFETYEELKKHP
jgi:hypothetical protein